MIDRIIDFSVKNKLIIFILITVACIWGWWSMRRVNLDAIPDLSETQVIIYSRWDRSPDIIEDQVTYPIVTAMLGAPRVKAVRGFSDFGYSFVYVIFQDDILSNISPVLSPNCPRGFRPNLGRMQRASGGFFSMPLWMIRATTALLNCVHFRTGTSVTISKHFRVSPR